MRLWTINKVTTNFGLIKSHNKKTANEKLTSKEQWNCRIKNDSPLDGDCPTNYVIYKSTASTIVNLDKAYLQTAK